MIDFREIITPESFDRLFDLLNPFRFLLAPFMKFQSSVGIRAYPKSVSERVPVDIGTSSSPNPGESDSKLRKRKVDLKLNTNSLQVPSGVNVYQSKSLGLIEAITPVVSAQQPDFRNTSFLFIKV